MRVRFGIYTSVARITEVVKRGEFQIDPLPKIGLTGVEQTTFPLINWAGTIAQGGSLTSLGRNNAGVEPNGSYIFTNDTTWIHGGHSIKWGAEVRKYFYNEDYRSGTSGTFTFGPWQTADPQNTSATGFSFASFLLGDVSKSGLNVPKVNPQSRVWNPAFYVADDWKVTRRLTVNIGLRWDIVGGLYETHGYSSGLDPTVANPGAGGYPGALVFLSDLNHSRTPSGVSSVLVSVSLTPSLLSWSCAEATA